VEHICVNERNPILATAQNSCGEARLRIDGSAGRRHALAFSIFEYLYLSIFIVLFNFLLHGDIMYLLLCLKGVDVIERER